MGNIYGYHRTSTTEQHLDRGITEITQFCKERGLNLEKIFTDQQTGKNFLTIPFPHQAPYTTIPKP